MQTMSDSEDLEELKNAGMNIPRFSLNGRTFTAKCVKVYDADTIHVVFSLSGQLHRFICRLAHIDAAELKSTGEENRVAIEGRDYLRDLILNQLIIIECGKFDKYGRVLVTITFNNENVNDLLVSKNYAYKYNGREKQEFKKWYNSRK